MKTHHFTDTRTHEPHGYTFAQLNKMKDCAIDIHKISAEAKARVEYCTALAHMAGNGEDSDANTLRAQFQQCVEQARQIAEHSAESSSNPDLQQVNHLISSISRTGDEDDDIQEELVFTPQRDMRCPVTSMMLVHPLKNSKCGHVYSTEGALHLLYHQNKTSGMRLPNSLTTVKSNWKALCPISGCNSHFQANTLKRDFQMELTQRQMQSTASHRESMDVDDIG